MMQTQPTMSSKIPAPDHHLPETRIVAQEIVHFLETVYHAASLLKTIPSRVINHVSNSSEQQPLLTQRLAALLETIYHFGSFIKTLYLFTASDFPTFAIPTILFGLSGALSGAILTTNTAPSLIATTLRIPTALLLIWTNLLVFNISNQRTPSAVAEDQINKPSRPIPAGRISIEAARRTNLVLVPVVLVLGRATGTWSTTLLLLALQWMYNDLRGSDESVVLRNALIAVGYGLYSALALRVLSGPEASITPQGYKWIAIIGLVMLTTQHICDIKDAAGDVVRGRRSAPIVLGDAACRWSVAVPVVVCSVLCPAFFGLGCVAYVFTLSFGLVVAGRTLFLRDLAADRATWKLWAGWTCSLFVLPLVASRGGVVDVGLLWEVVAHYACPGHDCVEKLNVLAVSGVAMVVKGGSMLGPMDIGGAEKNMTAVPSINVEVVA